MRLAQPTCPCPELCTADTFGFRQVSRPQRIWQTSVSVSRWCRRFQDRARLNPRPQLPSRQVCRNLPKMQTSKWWCQRLLELVAHFIILPNSLASVSGKCTIRFWDWLRIPCAKPARTQFQCCSGQKWFPVGSLAAAEFLNLHLPILMMLTLLGLRTSKSPSSAVLSAEYKILQNCTICAKSLLDRSQASQT